MLGLRSPKHIVASLTVMIFCLLSAAIAGAQTPAAALDKSAAQLTATLPKPVNAASDLAVDSPKAEPAKTETSATAAPPAPMLVCARTVKADIVAIPQPIMLNRLGARFQTRLYLP